MEKYDVIVIGGGPAGCSSALYLSRMGYRVVLLDQARFPRDKVCGEFISPACDSLLNDLGALSSIEALSPMRLRGVSISSYEKMELTMDYPPLDGSAEPMTSLSLPRITLDQLMLDRVVEAGVDVRQEHKVTDFIFDSGHAAGVQGRDAGKTPFLIRASIVLDAGGRNCISLRRLNLKKDNGGSGKIALAAHWEGTALPDRYCYMHISSPGYTGMAPIGENRVNVVLVVDSACLAGKDLQEFYVHAVRKNSLRREMIGHGQPTEKVRTVESLAYRVKPVPCGGLVLVGDAMGFIDPFTGEGIYLSIKSAEIACRVIDTVFQQGSDFSKGRLAVYAELRRRAFQKKFLLSQILQRLIYSPILCNQVIGALIRNPALAEKLVGVIGDYVDAEEVVSVGYLGQLLFKGWIPDRRVPSRSSTSL